MNNEKVAKFGGSSIATPERLGKIVSIVRADPGIKYVVVSAPGKEGRNDHKVTDLLILAHQEKAKGVSFENTFAIISGKFRRLATGTTVAIEEELGAIQCGIEEGRSLDWIASRGECLSAKIVSAVLGFKFIDAADI